MTMARFSRIFQPLLVTARYWDCHEGIAGVLVLPERDDLPKNRDLIDIVWLLLNKCGSDWWSYAKMSFNEWFSELLLTKHGTWSLIHMNGMIYQHLEMVISHDLYNSKKNVVI
jgi:hypothetical protein